MKRFMIWIAVALVTAVAVRMLAAKATPGMQTRCSEMRERMLGKMPESFPAKRTITDVGDIKEQGARTLDLVDEPVDATL